MSTKLQTVHVRVSDAGTGKPTPVRVRFTDLEGTYYPPLGRLARFATGRNQDVGGNVRIGRQPWAYVEGSFEIDLPPGPIQVEIHKGPEYRPVSQTIQLSPGKLALRFTIERLIDLPAQGWYSGDGRVHFISPHAALLEAQAEDVHVVNLLALTAQVSGPGETGAMAMTNLLAFSGQQPALTCGNHLVAVNTHNSHPVLGSLGLLNCHRVVYPLTFGGPQGSDDWTLADWCDQCHRKQGLVVWTRTWHENADFFVGEPLADLILRKIDAFEIDHYEDSPFDVLPLWYDLLNAGLAIPLMGSSGKESNASALGVMRTYARLQPGEEFSYKNWIEAVRAGRTFVSNGPLLLLSVNGNDPGAKLNLEKPGDKLHVRVEVHSRVPFERLEIVLNGAVIQATENAHLAIELPIAEGGWLAARCRGTHHVFDRPANQKVFAHTFPIYVQVNGLPPRRDAESVRKLTHQLDLLAKWIQEKANCPTPRDRERLAGVASAARAAFSANHSEI